MEVGGNIPIVCLSSTHSTCWSSSQAGECSLLKLIVVSYPPTDIYPKTQLSVCYHDHFRPTSSHNNIALAPSLLPLIVSKSLQSPWFWHCSSFCILQLLSNSVYLSDSVNWYLIFPAYLRECVVPLHLELPLFYRSAMPIHYSHMWYVRPCSVSTVLPSVC